MNIEQKMYKIIRGRFRILVDDLLLLFTEPNSSLIAESYEIYEDAYNSAYFQGSCVDSEVTEILVDNDLWNPGFERDLKSLYTQLENLKVEAFECFFDTKVFNFKKRQIFSIESQVESYLQKKHKMDFLSCENVAEDARWSWLIQQCVNPRDALSSHRLLEIYREKIIPQKEIREIARLDSWRQIWNASKKTDSLFGKPAIDLTNEQLALISYSIMYDNIYEHPESPSEEIVQDDYALDGWLILQRRNSEKEKTSREVDSLIKNPKIKNAQEVFIISKDKEQAKKIFDLNDAAAKNIIAERAHVINSSTGLVKDGDLPDVRRGIEIAATQAIKDKRKG